MFLLFGRTSCWEWPVCSLKWITIPTAYNNLLGCASTTSTSKSTTTAATTPATTTPTTTVTKTPAPTVTTKPTTTSSNTTPTTTSTTIAATNTTTCSSAAFCGTSLDTVLPMDFTNASAPVYAFKGTPFSFSLLLRWSPNKKTVGICIIISGYSLGQCMMQVTVTASGNLQPVGSAIPIVQKFVGWPFNDSIYCYFCTSGSNVPAFFDVRITV